jgi:hypothetical protein
MKRGIETGLRLLVVALILIAVTGVRNEWSNLVVGLVAALALWCSGAYYAIVETEKEF